MCELLSLFIACTWFLWYVFYPVLKSQAKIQARTCWKQNTSYDRTVFNRVSINECRETKTKAITMTNHNKHKERNGPIRTESKYTWPAQARENACDQVVIFGFASDWLKGNGYEVQQSSLSMLLFTFLKHNKVWVVSEYLKTFRLRNSTIVCERRTKDCARSWTFQH